MKMYELGVEPKQPRKPKNRKVDMRKIKKICTKVVIDYIEGMGTWTWRVAKPGDDPKRQIKIAHNTISRWDAIQELYDLYQEELMKLSDQIQQQIDEEDKDQA